MKTTSFGIYLGTILGVSLITACASNQVQTKSATQEHWNNSTVDYDVVANFAGTSMSGKATLYNERNNYHYRTILKIKTGTMMFSNSSEGEIRANTVATRRFNSGYNLFGMKRTNSQMLVDYEAKQYTLGSSNVQELLFDTVLDELSMIGYLQKTVENHPKQDSIHLPIFQHKTIQMVTATFGKPERMSTYGGVFENAIPITIQFSSGTTQSIRIILAQTQTSAPQKYTPIGISWKLNSGTVDLIYRSERH